MHDDIKTKLGVTVEERQVSIHELISARKEDRLLSVFGASTHCPILPVSRLVYKDTTVNLDIKAGRDFNKTLNKMLVEAMQADSGPWITNFE